ncbi:MAG: hypothetical protein ABSG49_05485 [Methanoregula sp.]|jgi:uncharacterized protein (DUF58 family)|uniref:hypothetical protein n=1 Tax=Methanoregula sp. TaxID=2052170 RepID=UPI003C23464A
MDRKIQILLVSGIVITLIVSLINIYAAGIVFVILIALLMSVAIMQDSMLLPDVTAELREDAKAVVIRNTGTATAVKIHVALVPMNIEFDLPALDADQAHEYPLEKMIEEVKAVVTFENTKGDIFSHSYKLSACGSEYDPLKPMIPLFQWK